MTLSAASTPVTNWSGPRAGATREIRALYVAAAILLGLSLAAALTGILVDDLYRGPESTASMFRADDLVTVLVAAPALAVATMTLRRASWIPTLAVTSVAAYLLYTYAYFLFGTGFNDLFLLHVAVFVAAGAAFALGLRAMGSRGAPRIALVRSRARRAALLLGTLTAALAGMWLWVGLDNALTGAIPAGSALVETDTMVRLGMVLDLALLVPFYASAVVLLWRGTGWGVLLATVALTSGLVHQVAYLVAMPMQVAAGVPGAVNTDPAEPVVVAVYLLAVLLVARSLAGPVPRRADTTR